MPEGGHEEPRVEVSNQEFHLNLAPLGGPPEATKIAWK